MSTNVNEGERALIDWQYKLGGSFFTHLMTALSVADRENWLRLYKGFPDHALSMHRFKTEPGYWDDLRRRAGIFVPSDQDSTTRTP